MTPLHKKMFKSEDSEDEFVSPANTKKTLHKKCGSEDEWQEEPSVLMTKGANDVNDKESHDEEDDSDAPEEESLNVAKIAVQSQEKQLKLKEIEQNKRTKEERRKRDQTLKEQKLGSNRRLLSAELLQRAEREAELAPQASKAESQILAKSLNKATHKRLDKSIYKKGPVTVKVLQKNRKILAPTKESIVDSKRDRFLKRRSIVRR